ncbi:hypothetical protein [Streptomyces koyangensis]|uniref:hypothetical protein n=1 Tax=Streptomyces koyangensis TaxID=188770 RepID=UPI003C2B0E21
MPHIRNHQVFATWITGLMHDAGAPGPAGAVRRQAARAARRADGRGNCAGRGGAVVCA